MNTAEKGRKGLRVLGKGERIRFYLDGLDRRFKVEPIVIEGLNHAVNFGIEFFRQQEVSIVCTEKEVVERKLWAAEKITIPARSAKLVKVRTEGDWHGEGVVESLPLEEQERGRNILLPESAYNLS